MIKLKRWLIAQLEDNWDLIESIWDDFNESKINTFEFLKNAMEILEEDIYAIFFLKTLKKSFLLPKNLTIFKEDLLVTLNSIRMI